MSNYIFVGMLSIFVYILVTLWAAKIIVSTQPKDKSYGIFFGSLAALFLHAVVLWQLVVLNWVNLGFYHALSFSGAFLVLSLLLAYWKYSLQNMSVFILPIAAFSLGLEMAYPDVVKIGSQANVYLDTHILLSILAYSFLTITALLSVLLFVQEKLLKTKHLTGVLLAFPALYQTEKTLFQIITLGFALLSVSLLSGFIYLDDIFAQHLAHKTFFSILAWLVFAVLLFGRLKYGWRGKTATKLVLLGFGFLLIAYFGSKWVLEFVL